MSGQGPRLAPPQAQNRVHVDFWLDESFDLSELASLLAVLDELRRLEGVPLFTTRLCSNAGGRVKAKCGHADVLTEHLKLEQGPGLLVLLGGKLPNQKALHHVFSRARAFGKYVLVLSDAVSALKRRNAFGSEKACVHWLDPLRLEFGNMDDARCDCLYMLGKKHATAAGRLSAPHAFLAVLRTNLGAVITKRIAERLVLGAPRDGSAPQRADAGDRYGTANSKLVQFIEIIESSLDEQIPMSEIAAQVGVTIRQIERICRSEMKCTPNQLREDIRLRWARWSVEHSMEPLIDIAVSCGFSSSAQMSKMFRRRLGVTPRELRRLSNQGSGNLLERAAAKGGAFA